MTEKKTETELLPVYILIRTSGRPNFFKNMMESIKIQTYPNIITIVHSDDPDDDYVEGDIIIRSERPTEPNKGRAPYNLYCNKLLDSIPDGDGWYHFMDDDDMYYDPESIWKLVDASKKDAVNVARSDRGNGNIWPMHWKSQKTFQTQCFFLHTDHKKKATWWSRRAGDHNYSGQLTATMPINWIDGLIVARAQEGKGRGDRYDLGDAPRDILKNITVPVYYLHDVKNPAKARGQKNDLKMICSKMAGKLQLKNFVKIVDMSDYKCFISNIMSK